MRENTILFPVCGRLYPYRMTHESFWLARRRIKPKFVVLMPGLQEALGKAGLRDLKTRLGEMGRCSASQKRTIRSPGTL